MVRAEPARIDPRALAVAKARIAAGRRLYTRAIVRRQRSIARCRFGGSHAARPLHFGRNRPVRVGRRNRSVARRRKLVEVLRLNQFGARLIVDRLLVVAGPQGHDVVQIVQELRALCRTRSVGRTDTTGESQPACAEHGQAYGVARVLHAHEPSNPRCIASRPADASGPPYNKLRPNYRFPGR